MEVPGLYPIYGGFMDTIKEYRKKFNEFALNRNAMTIDRLMTDKLDDYIILEEMPLPIQVGNKILLIGNFTFDTEHKFFHEWAMIISGLSMKIMNMEIAESRRRELLEKGNFDLLANGKWMLEFLLMDKWLKKQLCKLIDKTLLKQQRYYINKMGKEVKEKWQNCSSRYFNKHITKEALIQICYLIYFYNFDSQKKSMAVLMEKMNIKELAEMYIPFWLQNLGGLKGGFLNVRLPSIDSLPKDFLNKEGMRAKKNKGIKNKKVKHG